VRLLVIAGRRYTPALDAFIKIARLRDWKAERTCPSFQRINGAKPVVRKRSERISDFKQET
jgi:hypothetical protein